MCFQYIRTYIIKLTLIVFVLFAISGCSILHSEKPDLGLLYSLQSGTDSQSPVILIHGITGSRLNDKSTQKEVWPGSLNALLFSDYAYLKNQFDSESLEAKESNYYVSGITDKAVGRDFYGKIIDTLVNIGGYELNKKDKSLNSMFSKKHLFVFTYDWRQDNVKTASQLHQFILSIKQLYQEPNLKVDIIAHSMGGLITRYYVRYGNEDVTNDNRLNATNAGAEHIRRVILLGTPNFGSIGSVDALSNGVSVGFNTIPPETVVTFPSMYQLLPHALNDWLLDINGKTLDYDIFDISTWEELELSIFSAQLRNRLSNTYDLNSNENDFLVLKNYMHKQLERARRFSWSLSVPLPETKVSFIVFGGNCETTPARALLEQQSNNKQKKNKLLHFKSNSIVKPRPDINYNQLMLEPGDGTVTKASLLARQSYDPTLPRHEYSNFPLDYSFFLCESHDALTGNISFQDNLLNVLLSAD